MFKAILEWLIDNEATPYLHVDTRIAHVDVPQNHIKDNQIVLNISPSAIQNWHVDEQAISFSARFSGAPKNIYVPMQAVVAVYSKENGLGMAFPAEEPESSAKQSDVEQSNGEEVPSALEKKPPGKKISHLKVIK